MTMKQLPAAVAAAIESSIITEFATVSAAGVPIDTPTYCFPTDDLGAIGIATGLAYPAKAERARRNPKVGLLLECGPGAPVVAIRGLAAVRDADLQANAIRYLAETGYEAVATAAGVDWDQARLAVWYWTRIIVDIAPQRVLWWDSHAAMDQAPQVLDLDVPAGWRSDPAPAGKPSAPPAWPKRPWQEIADGAIARQAPGHLTLLDADGWPLPMPVRSATRSAEGFRLDIPAGAPWPGRAGQATLTFQGLETFVGTVHEADGAVVLTVERALPQNPLIVDPAQVLRPADDVRETLLERLRAECARRGQGVPEIPAEPPARTRLALGRQALAAAYTQLGKEETPQ
ncbi:MAG TPA: hypothetical protein VI199_05230 [Novosphingobium sp.]